MARIEGFTVKNFKVLKDVTLGPCGINGIASRLPL